jgi:drug/metabolite transporter (DMT)-like permease
MVVGGRDSAEDAMDKATVAVVAAAVMSGVGIAGDYFLKRASERGSPLATGWFLAGLVLYASTAFAWVFVMRHLKLATIGVIYSVSMVLLMAGMGVLLFGESLSRSEAAGIALAIASLFLLARQG